MKVYRAHRYTQYSKDAIEIKYYRNQHKAMDALTTNAGCYVEWKQMNEHHWAGLTSSDSKDDYYIVYIIDVIE